MQEQREGWSPSPSQPFQNFLAYIPINPQDIGSLVEGEGFCILQKLPRLFWYIAHPSWKPLPKSFFSSISFLLYCPSYYFEASCPIAMTFYCLSDTNTWTNNRFLRLALTFWPPAIFLTLFPPFPSIPHRFQPNQTRPCSANTPHPLTNPGLLLCQLLLEFSPVLISLSLRKFYLIFSADWMPPPQWRLHQFLHFSRKKMCLSFLWDFKAKVHNFGGR